MASVNRVFHLLHRQTDGRTMYYGKTLEDIAPKYMGDTIHTLDKRKVKLKELKEKQDRIQKEYDAIKEDGPAKFEKLSELQHAKKEADDAFLDVTNIFGGFVKVEDTAPVIEVYTRMYHEATKLHQLEERLSDAQLDLADAEYAWKVAKEAGKKTNKSDSKAMSCQERVQKINGDIQEVRANLASIHAEIDRMRKPYEQDEEFQRMEAYRDDGIDLARLTYNEIRLLRSDLQMIFQDPYSSLNPRMTVGQIISEGMKAHKMFKKNDARLQERIIKVMDDAGLQSYFIHRYPHQFSGGQRQRIGIARSLAVEPKFVVCDEAVSALDVSIQSQIINLLQDLKEQKNLTYLFITHDLSVVKYISDRIGVMYLGNLVELADSQEIFDHPLHPYTEALMNAIPTTDVENGREIQILEGDIPSPVKPPKGCKFHTRCKYCTEVCQHVTPEWVEASPNHFVACHHMLGSETEE